jgi:hypothetical protein
MKMPALGSPSKYRVRSPCTSFSAGHLVGAELEPDECVDDVVKANGQHGSICDPIDEHTEGARPHDPIAEVLDPSSDGRPDKVCEKADAHARERRDNRDEATTSEESEVIGETNAQNLS